MTTPNDKLLASIRERKNRRAEFGYGITTADQYVREAIKCVGEGMCSKMYGGEQKLRSALQKASNSLVYANPDMVTEAKSSKAAEFKALLPDGIAPPEHTLSIIRHVVTTPREDRDRDVLETEGASLDPRSPLLWQHMHHIPVGKVVTTIDHTKDVLRVASALLDLNDLTADAQKLVEADALRFSHGFRALEFEERKDDENSGMMPGFRITKFEIMEVSLVSVPSNVDAEIELFGRGKLASDFFKAHAKHYLDQRPVVVPGANFEKDQSKPAAGTQLLLEIGDTKLTLSSGEAASVETKQADGKPCGCDAKRPGDGKPANVKRFDDGTKGFNVNEEHLEASRLEYDWASRFLRCEVKEIVVVWQNIPSMRKGSWLSGQDEVLADGWKQIDIRNLTADGKETPPLRETIQLNSRERGTFLTDGIRFFQHEDGRRVLVKHEPTWGGRLMATTYAADDSGEKLLDECWRHAKEHNKLKGEAFSLTGDFIAKSDAGVNDVFLASENKEPLQRSIRMLQDKGRKMRSRGMIFMGPPGTGKTLSGRIMRNELDGEASFIWLSARDFWRTGAVQGMCAAFELAEELAPAVVFLEDVDNWIAGVSLDLMKTEMDGLAQRGGVLTVLTTNYPERLPDALIDRPGRFHDVCEFHLPDEKIRTEMLRRWTDGLDEKDLLHFAKQTDGFSGAHIYELAEFAKTLAEENEDSTIKDAMGRALEKIEKQRSLIDSEQLAGSHYRPSRREADVALEKGMRQIDWGDRLQAQQQRRGEDEDSDGGEDTKRGRSISKRNLKTIKEVADDLEDLAAMDLSRAAKALAERGHRKLKDLIDKAEPATDEDDDGKSSTIEAAQQVLECGDSRMLERMRRSIVAILEAEDRDREVAEYRELMQSSGR